MYTQVYKLLFPQGLLEIRSIAAITGMTTSEDSFKNPVTNNFFSLNKSYYRFFGKPKNYQYYLCIFYKIDVSATDSTIFCCVILVYIKLYEYLQQWLSKVLVITAFINFQEPIVTFLVKNLRKWKSISRASV